MNDLTPGSPETCPSNNCTNCPYRVECRKAVLASIPQNQILEEIQRRDELLQQCTAGGEPDK